MDALVVEGLCKTFGGVNAVKDVSFRVAAGERLGIIGPNGAGKTTLFNLLIGAPLPSAGRVFLHGREITRLPTHQRAHMGLARSFQIVNLFPNLTVLENTLLARLGVQWERYQFLRFLSAHRELYRNAEAALAAAELWAKRDELVRNIAYGEQRRLEIVMTMIAQPKVLLLDEPGAGLTAAECAAMAETIKGLGTQVTTILVDHDMDLVFSVAERVIVLHYGEIIAAGTPAAIQRDARVKELYFGIEAGSDARVI